MPPAKKPTTKSAAATPPAKTLTPIAKANQKVFSRDGRGLGPPSQRFSSNPVVKDLAPLFELHECVFNGKLTGNVKLKVRVPFSETDAFAAAVADVQLKGDYGGDFKTLRSTWAAGHPYHPEGGKCPHDGKYLAPYVRSPEQASMLAHVTAHVP